jgi:hypothetical protein
LADTPDQRSDLTLTNRYLLNRDEPFIPVSGEMHYSRVPRHRWHSRLRTMVSGGVTIVASYVPWLHHVEERGRPRFDANLDLAAFVDACAETGLGVILRIGPWCHGEQRNGGFPDWVAAADVAHRTDDPQYLALVAEWFDQLGTHLADRCQRTGAVLAVQLENELYDQPGHLSTLKRLARRAGISAPLWTATAWGGAALPAEEIMPVYGGYPDGFWAPTEAPWDTSFRHHFFFSHTWDDPGIGADQRRAELPGPRRPWPSGFPPATCELGGGMATAYHRRPVPSPRDVAAVAHCKIGSGSAWQGYYMYVGGTNPIGRGGAGMQETQSTGYPNDLPRLTYDFHAPVGEAGDLTGTHAELRRQHAFLAAFGSRLATMPSSLPAVAPRDVYDRDTPRWALRSDGHGGFLFLNWHQPYEPLQPLTDMQFRLHLDNAPEGTALTIPAVPITIPPGTLARWPVRQRFGPVGIDWITASPLTVLEGDDRRVLVVLAEPGIPVEVRLPPTVRIVDEGPPTAAPDYRPGHDEHTFIVAPTLNPLTLAVPAGELDVLVLPAAVARDVWVQQSPRRLLLSTAELSWGPDGVVHATTAGPAAPVDVYDLGRRRFIPLDCDRPAGHGRTGTCAAAELRPARRVPASYGERDARLSAPDRAELEDLAAVYRLSLPAWTREAGVEARLDIDWAGDLAELRVDGRTVSDRFWDGTGWRVDLRDCGLHRGADVTVHILPLARDSRVWLSAHAQATRSQYPDQLLSPPVVTVREVIACTEHSATSARQNH